jgi:hypothetical protein
MILLLYFRSMRTSPRVVSCRVHAKPGRVHPLEPIPGLLSGRVLTITYILIGTRPFALPRSYAPLWTIGPSDRGVARDLERCEHDYTRWAVHHIHIKVYCDYSFVLVPPAYSPECVEEELCELLRLYLPTWAGSRALAQRLV